MKLSKSDYQRGLLSWAPIPETRAEIRSGEAGQESEWSAPLEDPAGSVVLEVLGSPIQLRFGFADPSKTKFPYPARLERLDPDGAVRTRVWDRYDEDDVQIVLAHVPNYGYYHRMVVSVTSLEWGEDTIIHLGDVLVRFISDVVVGEYSSSMQNMEPSEGGYTVTGTFGTDTLSGRFIDITAPGESLEEAAKHARGIYGLIVLLFGDQSIGDIAIENSYEALPRTMQRSVAGLDVIAKPNVHLPDEAFIHLDGLVSNMVRDEPITKYIHLSLHWYEQGCQAAANLDRFMAFFIGVETLFKGFVRIVGEVKVAQQRRAKYEPALLKAFKMTMDKDVQNSLIGSLGRASQREEFEKYASARNMPSNLRSIFSPLSRVRNGIVHGDATEPSLEDVRNVRALLTAMLKAELGIPFLVPWERDPGVLRIELPFNYLEYGWEAKENLAD